MHSLHKPTYSTLTYPNLEIFEEDIVIKQYQGVILLPVRVQNSLVVLNLGSAHDYKEKLDLLIEILN